MKRYLQFGLLAVAAGAAFLVGYVAVAKAWPGVPDRNEYYGYFQNIYDDEGDSVIAGGFPAGVVDANSFIAFIENRLYFGSAHDSIGAQFIIQIMRGNVSGWSRNSPPTAAEIADWEARVRYAGSQGWILWANDFNYTGNSYWQGNMGGGPEPNDDAFFYETGTRISIIFMTSTGAVANAIKRDCGNPLTFGYMPGLDVPPPNWTTSGRTTVSSPTVKPGQSVDFSHYVRNNGPDSTGVTNIWWAVEDRPSGTILAGANSGPYAAGEEKNVNNNTVNVPLNAVVGSQICQLVGWDPASGAGARNAQGPTVCSTVIPDFALTPVVIADKPNGAEGDQVTFTYQVTSSGVTPSINVNCTPIGNSRAPGWSPLPQQDVARTADVGYTAPATSCPRVFQPNTPTTVATETITLGTLTAGSRVCRSLVVNPKDETGGPRTSAETCVVIAKTPYSRFMGNDIWAGGGFAAVNPSCNTSAKITTVGRTLTSGAKAGSVTEYQAFALNQITGFGSAGHVLNGFGALGDVSRMLTFANSEPVASQLGYYGAAAHCINDHTANYATAPNLAPGAYTVNGRGSGAWRVAGPLTLSGTMPLGGQQVYYATGDVTINADLVYPGVFVDLPSIPSLLVITTGNIFVSPNVQQIDGTFIARGDGAASGVFYTCWPKNEPSSVTHPCNANRLTVNGAVAAGRLDLQRSFGATGATDAQRQDPAEVFMFTPEHYLRNVINATTGITIETTNVLDLPPRF